MKVVCDASIVIDAFLSDDGTDQAEQAFALLMGIRRREIDAYVPWFFKVECASALVKYQRRHPEEIKVKDAMQTLGLIDLLPLVIHQQPLTAHLVGGWAFAMNCGAYDAVYIELARQLNAHLATTDRGMRSACKRFNVPLWTAHGL